MYQNMHDGSLTECDCGGGLTLKWSRSSIRMGDEGWFASLPGGEKTFVDDNEGLLIGDDD